MSDPGEPRNPLSGPDRERRRPARDKPAPYDRKKTGPKPQAHKTSAKPVGPQKKENLTLGDWLEVVAYADAHPGITQPAIELYFKTRPEGALQLSQPSISRNLSAKGRAALEKRRLSHANALDMKRGRFVVRPDVDHALWIWQQSMEERGETPDGNMLVAKRTKFEELFDVPANERMTSRGWLSGFTKACVLHS
ncbi:unnamed protein product [Peniophora sp. CBMAI 1063]|nr:unnamed protein product [Peniophora sp. CBMAI 1063]